MKEHNVVAIIPARGNSKRIPGKNMKLLKGKPLLFWTLDVALESSVDMVVLSTEDQPLIDETLNYIAGKNIPKQSTKLTVLQRPPYLSQDHVQTDEVYLHVLRYLEQVGYKAETLVLLTPTSPFRTKKNIEDAIRLYENTKCTVISTFTDKRFHWTLEPGVVNLSPIKHNPLRRLGGQWVGKFDWLQCENGAVYVVNADKFSLERNYRLAPFTCLEMTEEQSVEIDTPLDWALAEIVAASLE